MRDRNILITGGTSGIGKGTANHFAKMGAQLLLVGRNRDKGEAAVAKASATNDLLTLEQIVRYPDVTFYNYGPGLVQTATITGTLPGRLFFNTIGPFFSRSAEQAANDIVALLTGEYPSGFYGRSLKRNEPSVAKSDAARLWDYSQQLIDNLSA